MTSETYGLNINQKLTLYTSIRGYSYIISFSVFFKLPNIIPTASFFSPFDIHI